MSIQFNAEMCQDLDASLAAEWLCTNGLGGYASGTVAGANTRKYHGLLVVAAHPPVERYVVLSRLEDRVIVEAAAAVGKPKVKEKSSASNGAKVYDLSTNEFVDVIHPQGYRHVTSFEIQGKNPGPLWRYDLGGMILEKSITLVHGQDAVIVRYNLLPGKGVGGGGG